MDINLISAFDFHGIAPSCWKTCDSTNGVYNGMHDNYEVDYSTFPVYRGTDPKKRQDFLEVASFFGCVDICQSTSESKRFALLVPICLGGKYNNLI